MFLSPEIFKKIERSIETVDQFTLYNNSVYCLFLGKRLYKSQTFLVGHLLRNCLFDSHIVSDCSFICSTFVKKSSHVKFNKFIPIVLDYYKFAYFISSCPLGVKNAFKILHGLETRMFGAQDKEKKVFDGSVLSKFLCCRAKVAVLKYVQSFHHEYTGRPEKYHLSLIFKFFLSLNKAQLGF